MKIRGGALLVLSLFGWLATTAQADQSAEQLLKQEIDRRDDARRERRWAEPLPSLPAPSQPALAPAAPGGPCFPIQTIEVVRAEVLGAKAVAAVVSTYRGHCLTAADLQQLQQRLNALALSRGLVTTRVLIPEQNLRAGQLRLEVWPGMLEAVDAGPGLQAREVRLSLPAQPGAVLNLRDLEQAVENLNRLASMQANVALEPGRQPGGSVARFSAQRATPWQASLAVDSQAIEFEPVTSLRAGLVWDSPLRLADRLVLGLNGNVRDAGIDNANGWSLDYDLPAGYWRLAVGLDRFDYHNPVTTGLTTFTASGTSQSWRGELSRPLWRQGQQRLSLALHGQRRLSENFIDDVAIGVSTNRLSALGLRLDWSQVAAPWVWDASLNWQRGEMRSLATPAPADHRYQRLSGNTRVQRGFGRQQLSLSLNGQWSDDRLLPSEQFALVGPGSVRSFAPYSYYANTAVAARTEWSVTLPATGAGLTALRPALAVDAALAPGRADDAQSARFAAVAGSVTGLWRSAQSRITVSCPLNHPDALASPSTWQLDASLSLSW